MKIKKCRFCKNDFEVRWIKQKYCCNKCASLWNCYNNKEVLRNRKKHKAPWLRKINLTPGRNKRIATENADKIRAGQPNLGESKFKIFYTKFHGRHHHRQIMEKIAGRKLTSDDIVHHIDGNTRNNEPSNLMLTNRRDHARHHFGIESLVAPKERSRPNLPA